MRSKVISGEKQGNACSMMRRGGEPVRGGENRGSMECRHGEDGDDVVCELMNVRYGGRWEREN